MGNNLCGGQVIASIRLHVVDRAVSTQEVIGDTYLLTKVTVDQDYQVITISMEAQAAPRHIEEKHAIEATAAVVDHIHTTIRSVVVVIVASATDQSVIAILTGQNIVAGTTVEQIVA